MTNRWVRVVMMLLGISGSSFWSLSMLAAEPEIPRVIRLLDKPIITPDLDQRMGSNIQGPSLIRVPDWIDNPLGKYYLYFADHRGFYIRMAYADDLLGPWTVYTEGTLKIEDSFFPMTCPPCAPPGSYAHIASPDVHVREDLQQIVMYLHGRDNGAQLTRAAVSKDGIHFAGREESLGSPYFRVMPYDGYYYALAMPGQVYRSLDGLTDFEPGPRLFNPSMRHSALLLRDDILYVFWTQVGHAPETILLSTIPLHDDWRSWKESAPVEILRPATDWEGARLPIEPSVRGDITVPVNQLRDPAIYTEEGRVFLFYSVAGESGIAVAELLFD